MGEACIIEISVLAQTSDHFVDIGVRAALRLNAGAQQEVSPRAGKRGLGLCQDRALLLDLRSCSVAFVISSLASMVNQRYLTTELSMRRRRTTEHEKF